MSKINIVDEYLFTNFNYDIHRTIQKKNKLAIIIEPRPHYRLKQTIVNILHYLGNDWDLLFIGNSTSIHYLKLILPHVDCFTEEIENKNLNPYEYSSILMNKNLFHKYNYENWFVFQTDSFLIKHMNNEYLFQHDYIGASDYMKLTENSVIRIYNGGISFRKKSFMLYCLNNISIDDINNYRKQKHENSILIHNNLIAEDFYYSMCLSIKENKSIEHLPINTHFGQNNDFFNIDNVISVHSYDKYDSRFLSYDNLVKILQLTH